MRFCLYSAALVLLFAAGLPAQEKLQKVVFSAGNLDLNGVSITYTAGEIKFVKEGEKSSAVAVKTLAIPVQIGTNSLDITDTVKLLAAGKYNGYIRLRNKSGWSGYGWQFTVANPIVEVVQTPPQITDPARPFDIAARVEDKPIPPPPPVPPPPPAMVNLFSAADLPQIAAVTDAFPYTLGIKLKTSNAGLVYGVKYYRGVMNDGPHVGAVFDDKGQLLSSATFADESPTGWQSVYFSKPVPIASDQTFIVAYHAPKGHYAYTLNGLNAARSSGVLTAAVSAGIFVQSPTLAAPTRASLNNYWVDVIWANSDATERPPVVGRGVGWDSPTKNVDGSALTDLEGYVIRWGNSPNLMSNEIKVSLVNEWWFPADTVYPVFAIVAAHDGENNTSPFSAAVEIGA